MFIIYYIHITGNPSTGILYVLKSIEFFKLGKPKNARYRKTSQRKALYHCHLRFYPIYMSCQYVVVQMLYFSVVCNELGDLLLQQQSTFLELGVLKNRQ